MSELNSSPKGYEVTVIIKFKDRNRSDLTLKLQKGGYVDTNFGLIRIPLETNGKAQIIKTFAADTIAEMTEVVKEEG